MSLEQERHLLEELDIIKDQISKRLKRYPSIHENIPSSKDHGLLATKSNVPQGLIFLERHEVKQFLNNHKDKSENLLQFLQNDLHSEDIDSLKIKDPSDSNHMFDSFNTQFLNLIQNSNSSTSNPVAYSDPSIDYNMFSSKIIESDEKYDHRIKIMKRDRIHKNKKLLNKYKIHKYNVLSANCSNLKLSNLFSNFENYNKFLDLKKFYNIFINLPKNYNTALTDTTQSDNLLEISKKLYELKNGNNENNTIDEKPISLLDYSKIFNSNFDTNLYDIDKSSIEYLNYLKDLFEYLKSYYIKIQPLSKPEISILKIENDFKEKLENSNDDDSKQTDLFCKYCDKTFTNEGVYNSHLSGKKHKKNVAKQNQPKDEHNTVNTNSSTNSNNVIPSNNNNNEVEYYQYMISEISQLLFKQVTATQREIERRELLTEREKLIEIEMNNYELSDDEYDFIDPESVKILSIDETSERPNDEDGSNADEDDDDEDDANRDDLYNPLKLPIGPDGRPMPYWLWKLNGLDFEFKCEICGNFNYKGRKIFDNHFKEKRHLNGLKMLGIDSKNIEIFKDLTQINDVLKLSNNLRKLQREDLRLKDESIEVEDSEGNVMSKKTYDQLKKQGLL
ncbi:unnamed protein product [[Candida] boidinii]|uniref:Unnamed protein product n=1 Tax=Candida boidinii TaxID=5477 RepID=A0A9W6SXH5_CANBO|nr:hypothetical protein B5S30_g779 [[Candida] boidinii]GME69063.1 unnamed protein product [[Candida] boidinii]